jgi:predicted transcriptional regulator
MSTTLTIRIDDALERELKQYAVATHRPKSDIVREALRRQLALARFRAVREEVMPLAERCGLLTDEDVFRTIGGMAPGERLP